MDKANMIENVEYFRKWASDIRESSGSSVDADQIEDCANELEKIRMCRLTGLAHINALVHSLNELITIFDMHPQLPKEDGELPILDRARTIYGDTIRKIADGRI